MAAASSHQNVYLILATLLQGENEWREHIDTFVADYFASSKHLLVTHTPVIFVRQRKGSFLRSREETSSGRDPLYARFLMKASPPSFVSRERGELLTFLLPLYYSTSILLPHSFPPPVYRECNVCALHTAVYCECTLTPSPPFAPFPTTANRYQAGEKGREA